MRTYLIILAIVLTGFGSAHGHGLLIPKEVAIPPLAMLNHKVVISVDEQLVTTRVEQTFRNHTDRALEATYVFPVPRNASVNQFTMWIDGKETRGELMEARKAREIYTSIVRRTQDPGLLEYLDNNLFQVKVFPVPARGDQKIALAYTSVASREGGVVEYSYPLKTDGKANATLEEFSISATIKSVHGVSNVYSPTHAITVKRKSDNEVAVAFDRSQGLLDKDFQMFFSNSQKDVGLSVLQHRPLSKEDGYVALLVSPKMSLGMEYTVPRDMVFVLDTSGSMRGPKMDQARQALKYCLKNLNSRDRFALLNFATTVNRYRDKLVEVSSEQQEEGRKWIDNLESTGGTAINDALLAALEYRGNEEGRTFTIVFFTDGQPTIGETNVEKIIKNTLSKNTASTRIFTFGVGDDVNATMLDQLAEQTRAVSTYVRPAEDIEAKVSGLVSKISHPVLTNLKLSATGDVSLSEIYPPQLPDLFQGGQLLVMARYHGKGPSAIRLTGMIGKETKEFAHDVNFVEKTGEDRGFVEHLWARRKVGYLLDQIRANGEKKELVDEVVSLAKHYGITTPYTSWLVVPDAVLPVAKQGAGQDGFNARGGMGKRGLPIPTSLAPAGPAMAQKPVIQMLEEAKKGPGGGRGLESFREQLTDRDLANAKLADQSKDDARAKGEAGAKKALFDQALNELRNRNNQATQSGKLGVDLSIEMNRLRTQSRLEKTAQQYIQGRNVLDIGGVWVDERFNGKQATLVIKAQSDAYFRILERHKTLRDVYRLGNHLVWITPSGTALVIDTTEGKEKLEDQEIDRLFIPGS